MILPSTHLSQDRALLTIGARLLVHLDHPRTASALWEEIVRATLGSGNNSTIRYDAYILSLDLLFLMGAIEFQNGLLSRTAP